MNKITNGKLFELYLDTLDRCGQKTRNLSDEMIGYNIFEEFITGMPFFSKESLDKLLDDYLIDEEIYSASEKLKKHTFSVPGTEHWNIESFKCSKPWDEIIELSDFIKGKIYEEWKDRLPELEEWLMVESRDLHKRNEYYGYHLIDQKGVIALITSFEPNALV